MAPLLNAKEWFKKRRVKKKCVTPNPNVYIPGIGYPPTRNSSQPTLIPYVPPSPKGYSDDDEEYDIELDLDEDGLPEFIICRDSLSAATTTCMAISAALNGAEVPDEENSSHGLLAGPRSSSSSSNSGTASGIGSDSGAASAATLVSSIPACDSKPFALGYKYNKHNGSHSSLPAQLSGQLTSELASPPSSLQPKHNQAQPGQIRHSLTRNLNYLNNRHKRNSEQAWSQAQIQSMPQPNLQPLQEIEKSPSSVSKETLESRAQEYARTVKTLWQMVEDKSLATRLKDASPDERERLIANHKNALFPLKFSASSADGSSARARGHVSSRLSRIDEAGQSSNHRRGCNVSKDGALNRSADGLSETSSMPNSPVAGPINSDAEDAKKARRSTLLSPMVMQSAMELQKRDHYTIQQRVDMEEDWRMQAKLLKSVSEQEARGVRRVHAQLLQRQLQQRRAEGFKEYEPTHQDFNKWFDLKEELDDSQVPDLNDDVRGFDLKEEFEYEDERKERETREEEDLKKKELEELEHELNILGIDRFESLLGFVEADDAEQVVPSSLTPEEQDKHRLRQMILHEQLQEQYNQLQLELQHHRAGMKANSAKAKALQRKKLLAPAPSGAAPPPPPLASRPANSSANASVVVMPLKPRNGRKMFSDCDSMIIKDMPIVAPPTH